MQRSPVPSHLLFLAAVTLASVAIGCGTSSGRPPDSGPGSWPGRGEAVWVTGITSLALVSEGGGDTATPPAGSTCGTSGGAAEHFDLDVATRVFQSHVCSAAAASEPLHWVDRTQTLSAADADALVNTVKAVTVATTCGTCSAVATPNTLTLQVGTEARTYSDDDFCACGTRAVAPFADNLGPVLAEARKLAFQ